MPTSPRRHRSPHRRRLSVQRIRRMEGGALLGLAVVVVLLATLLPTEGEGGTHLCLICGPHAGADLGINLVLFLPIGMGLALLGTPWRIALAIGFGMTFLIELLQLMLPIGRVASVSHLATNVAGTALGIYLTRRRRAILYPRSRAALRFAIIGGGLWLLTLVLTGVGMRPSIPDGAYVGQWSPSDDAFNDRSGRVVSASLSGFDLPDGPLDRMGDVRAAMRKRTKVEAQAHFVAGRGGFAPLLRVVDDEEREIVLLAQRRLDLLFRARVLATNIRLFTPGIVMFDALAGVDFADGQTILIDAQRAQGTLRMSAYGREEVLPLHSGAGWMFFAPPATVLHRAPELASIVWIGIPLFIIGYWTGRRARRKARRAGDAFRLTGTAGQVLSALPILGALVVTGLAGLSFPLGLAIPGPAIWVGAFAALGCGLGTGISTALSHDDRAHGTSRTHDTGTTAGALESVS